MRVLADILRAQIILQWTKNSLSPQASINLNELPTSGETPTQPRKSTSHDVVSAQTLHFHRETVGRRLNWLVIIACAEMKWQCQTHCLGSLEKLISLGLIVIIC